MIFSRKKITKTVKLVELDNAKAALVSGGSCTDAGDCPGGPKKTKTITVDAK